MLRRSASPIHISAVTGASLQSSPVAFSENFIQELVHRHPEALPIGEIDAAYLGAVPVCRELNTPAGPIDNFLVTADGLPVIVECKLWRNPQARREVVGQVLDYAKELSRWTSADIEREAARRGVQSLFELVRASHPDADEAAFHDGLSTSLAKGRCLLLILGDGIRQGVEAIFDHLQTQGSLQFSFGLVEFPIYELPDGAHLAVPSILARSRLQIRQVIEFPAPYGLAPDDDEEPAQISEETRLLGDRRQAFWVQFLEALDLDDPEQPLPSAPRLGHYAVPLPVPRKSSWITLYRDITKGEVGIFLSWSKGSAGERIVAPLLEQRGDELRSALGEGTRLQNRTGTQLQTLIDSRQFGDLSDPNVTARAVQWLAARTNDFVNVLRPAVRSAASEAGDSAEAD